MEGGSVSLREDNANAARVPPGQWAAYLSGDYRLPPEPAPTDPSAREGLDTYDLLRKRGD